MGSFVGCGDDSGNPASAIDAAAGLRWYRACGPPSCQTDVPDGGVSGGCQDEQKEGQPCSDRDAFCSSVYCSERSLVCTDKATDLTHCPISRRQYKEQIVYVDDAAREALLSQLLELRLATYRLKGRRARGAQLGFIIDDGVPNVAVGSGGNRVNLYGFISLVAAAVQAQARQIEALQREVERLRRRTAMRQPPRSRARGNLPSAEAHPSSTHVPSVWSGSVPHQ